MNRLTPKGVVRLFKESFIGWNQNEAMLHAAALAYYTIFSLDPMIKEFSLMVGFILFNAPGRQCRTQEYLHQLFPDLDDLSTLFRFGASPLLFLVIFAVIFKTFPKARIMA